MEYSYSYMANYLRKILPNDIESNITVSESFIDILNELPTSSSIEAFRDLLRTIYDYISSKSVELDSSLPVIKNEHDHVSLSGNFPILDNIKSVLFNIGYLSEYQKEQNTLLVNDVDSLKYLVSCEGWTKRKKLSNPKWIQTLNILKDCGFLFEGLEIVKNKVQLLDSGVISIKFPNDKEVLLGLRSMAYAEKHLSRKGNHNIFLRCDYHAFSTKPRNVLKTFKELHETLPEIQQESLLNLHLKLIEIGLTCELDVFYSYVRFIYYIGKREVLTVSLAIDSGHRVLIKTGKLEKYKSEISYFPNKLLDIISKGYGCNKKRDNESCQMGCHGYSFDVATTLLEFNQYIVDWIRFEYDNSNVRK